MKSSPELKTFKRQIRHRRVRAKVSGSALRPRLSVFRANQNIYAQLIDDAAGRTLACASSLELKDKKKKSAIAFEVGRQLAGKALVLKIEQVVFDRGGYAYHGRVKSLADGAREGGLKF
jgi:large subunit ribosomal protein L18